MLDEHVKLNSAGEAIKANFDAIEGSSFWNIGDERELKIHRIHAYPAKFPAFITTKALSYAKSQCLNVSVMADIFCGCGTVALEARRNEINFWGCDINPVATMIARAKSTSYQSKKLSKYYKAIMLMFLDSSGKIDFAQETKERLLYWHPVTQYEDLARLLNAINAAVPARSSYRTFFHCAFSNILKPTSRWLTKSIKPQIDPNKVPLGVKEAFAKQCTLMMDAYEQVEFKKNSDTKILTGSVFGVEGPTKKVDMIVTSPPYVTSYEYADLHQLSSLWLGFAKDYRELREGSIGSSQHNLDFNREIKRLNTVGSRVVFGLYDRDKSIAKANANYYLDMQAVAKRCAEMVRPNGLGVFVIGDTEYKGVKIENAAHLSESLLENGFKHVKVSRRRISGKFLTPYRDAQGKFTQSQSGRHVYGEEYVLVAKR